MSRAGGQAGKKTTKKQEQKGGINAPIWTFRVEEKEPNFSTEEPKRQEK